MRLGPIFTSQRFGVPVTIAIAASIWLTTTAVAHCSNGYNTIKCGSDALVVFLIEYNAWPYDNMPFTGYWDTHDNKLASIIAEPYSRLVITGSMTYLIWFRTAVYVSKRDRRKHAARIHSSGRPV